MAEYFAQPEPYPTPPLQPDGHVEPRPEGMPLHAHESTDVRIRPLVVLGGITVVFLILTVLFLIFIFNVFSGKYDAYQQTDMRAKSALSTPKREVTAPKLQGVQGYNDRTAAREMADYREKIAYEMTTYGKSANGSTRIPVSRAMELALEKQMFKAAPANKSAAAPAQQEHNAAPQDQKNAPQEKKTPTDAFEEEKPAPEAAEPKAE